MYYPFEPDISFSIGLKGQGMAMNRSPMGGNPTAAGAAGMASSEVLQISTHTLTTFRAACKE